MAEKTRKLWLDWQRGLAVLYMVEWHTYDSWRADAVARGPAHTTLSILGGFAAPSFLYMAGMSQLLAVAALTPWAARTPPPLAPMTEAIGNGFLTKWLLPFEGASLVLLATLVGAVVIARKEIKAD